jgi:hypothetical protein
MSDGVKGPYNNWSLAEMQQNIGKLQEADEQFQREKQEKQEIADQIAEAEPWLHPDDRDSYMNEKFPNIAGDAYSEYRAMQQQDDAERVYYERLFEQCKTHEDACPCYDCDDLRRNNYTPGKTAYAAHLARLKQEAETAARRKREHEEWKKKIAEEGPDDHPF